MRERTRWAALTALLVLTPLAFYPGLLTGELPLLHAWESGYADWLRSEAVIQVLGGHAPLWSSGHLAGVPVLEDPRSALGSPQSWLTWLLGPAVARGVCAWLFTALAGVGALLWGRSRELGAGAALVLALLAQANPLLHLGLVEGSAATLWLLPWCLLALERSAGRRGAWLAVAVAAVLCAGDAFLGGWTLLVLLAYWLHRGAQGRTLAWILAGALLAAPLCLPVWVAWVAGEGTLAGQGWPQQVPWLWLAGSGPGLAALVGVLVWLLAVPVALAVDRWVPERGQAATAALALVLGVLLCAPLRELGTPPTQDWVQALPSGRTLGLEGVPLMAQELRGAPLFPSQQARRFASILDPETSAPGLWVGSINAQNRKVLEFAAVHSVVAQGPLFGLAPLGESGPVSVYGLDGGPRAWLTPGGRPAANEREALDFLRTGYAFREAPAIQELDRRLPTEGVITPLELEDLGATIRIALPQGASGVLVLADRWEPAWQVQVDGAPAALLQVGGLFRGVLLPVGAAEVVFAYRPWAWSWGLGLGFLGALLSLGLLWPRPSLQETSP